MRIFQCARIHHVGKFLSIQAQDFIEDTHQLAEDVYAARFLSIQAQDFIEEMLCRLLSIRSWAGFLSIQAQDFIEEPR